MFCCLVAGWLITDLVLVLVLLANQVSLHAALAWPYVTGKLSLLCWLFLGIPIAVFDPVRAWFHKLTTASLFGGILGVASLAAYLHGFIGFIPFSFAGWLSTLGLHAVAFGIGSVSMGLYYRLTAQRG
jgi:hypothetical protein